MVLEKNGEDQFDRWCEKLQVLHSVKEEGNILHKKKEGGLTGMATSCVGTAF